MYAKKIIVIGAGIIGLTTAAKLVEFGYDVDIYAKDTENLVSHTAAAVWFPYNVGPRNKVIDWGKQSYSVFEQQCNDPASGVKMVDLALLYSHDYPDPWWKQSVPFCKSLKDEEIKSITPYYHHHYKQAHVINVSFTAMDYYMEYLKEKYSLTIYRKKLPK